MILIRTPFLTYLMLVASVLCQQINQDNPAGNYVEPRGLLDNGDIIKPMPVDSGDDEITTDPPEMITRVGTSDTTIETSEAPIPTTVESSEAPTPTTIETTDAPTPTTMETTDAPTTMESSEPQTSTSLETNEGTMPTTTGTPAASSSLRMTVTASTEDTTRFEQILNRSSAMGKTDTLDISNQTKNSIANASTSTLGNRSGKQTTKLETWKIICISVSAGVIIGFICGALCSYFLKPFKGNKSGATLEVLNYENSGNVPVFARKCNCAFSS